MIAIYYNALVIKILAQNDKSTSLKLYWYSLPNKILTVLFLAVALACLVASSLSAWYQYQNNPTSMVVDFDHANFNITKPAITVCLYEKVSTDKFPEVFKKFGVQDTQEARNFFLFISNATYATLNQTPIYNDTPPEKWLEILRDLYVRIEQSRWTEYRSDGFSGVTTDIVTEKGMCTIIYGAYGVYSSVNYWLSENCTVFPQHTLPVYTYAYRDERITLNNIPGPYEMAFHHPNELPQYGDSWYDFMESGTVLIKLDVLEVESTDYMQTLSQRQRTCNYPEEGELKMWPVYTRNMCLLECRYNFFKSTCGCYPYFARPLPGVPICNATQLHCIGDAAKAGVSLKEQGVNFCNCRDSCDTARYKIISLMRTKFEEKTWSNGVKQFVNNRMLNIDLQFPYFKLYHEVFFGYNEFLVSVGGAAGLFLGASIISFVEIFYYVTLRLFWYKNTIVNKAESKAAS